MTTEKTLKYDKKVFEKVVEIIISRKVYFRFILGEILFTLHLLIKLLFNGSHASCLCCTRIAKNHQINLATIIVSPFFYTRLISCPFCYTFRDADKYPE